MQQSRTVLSWLPGGLAEALGFTMRKACSKSRRLAHGSAAPDGERSPCPSPARCPRSGSGLRKNPPYPTHGHGGFVIASGGHRHPCLYHAITLAGFVSAVRPVGWCRLLCRFLLRSRFESPAQSFQDVVQHWVTGQWWLQCWSLHIVRVHLIGHHFGNK